MTDILKSKNPNYWEKNHLIYLWICEQAKLVNVNNREYLHDSLLWNFQQLLVVQCSTHFYISSDVILWKNLLLYLHFIVVKYLVMLTITPQIQVIMIHRLIITKFKYTFYFLVKVNLICFTMFIYRWHYCNLN